MKLALRLILAGILAAVLFATPWEYCMAGRALGVPFSWLHPGHDEWGEVAVGAREPEGDVVDVPNLMVSLALWGAAVALVGRLTRRR